MAGTSSPPTASTAALDLATQFIDRRTPLSRVRGVLQIKLVTTSALLPPLHDHGAEDGAPAPPGL